MIRFVPDTWRDAIMRPLAMASPDGAVYVEIIAPDFRFVFILVLAVVGLVAAVVAARRRHENRLAAPTTVLLALTLAAFVPWLASTGNGRYFIAFLLVAGPLSIGLAHAVPASRRFRLTLVLAMVVWQGYLIQAAEPWRTWGHLAWGDGPAFPIEVPADLAAQPATYVTLSSISYSIVAPRFHPASRWINISTQRGLADKSADSLRAQALIAAPGVLKVLFPTVPGGQDGDRVGAALAQAIDGLLARQGLSIENLAQCRLLPSGGMAALAVHKKREAAGAARAVHGFWVCPLARHANTTAAEATPIPPRSQEVFAKLERMCPRIFPPGDAAASLHIPAGVVRAYPGSDFRVYVLNDERVWYKYFRALNPVQLGTIDAVLADKFSMDCERIRGRTGLPWEREI
ncbi:hypothetical protein [Ramlibacter sp.]|uniref:hypothetical protein n=1 Tax=Ramlibacter sp. TaxID=1917967 RepID=UPI002BB308D6|nr:hypothetical protein [Ramlibacter sp.]HWI84198.1 hypothetical protein [Ramlibacter sp.]